MTAIFAKWKTVYAVLAVALVSTFALSGVGQSRNEAERAASDTAWIGTIFWVAFGITVLVLVIYTVALLIHRVASGARSTA